MEKEGCGQCSRKSTNAIQTNGESVPKRLLMYLFESMHEQVKIDLENRIVDIKKEVREVSMFKEFELKECKLQKIRQLLLFVAKMLRPELAECLKLCVVENSCVKETEAVGGRGGGGEQLLPAFAEMLYPVLTTYLKSCMVGKSCGQEEAEEEEEEEDFIGLSINVEEEVKECDVHNSKQCLSLFTNGFNCLETAKPFSSCENPLKFSESCKEVLGSSMDPLDCQRNFLTIFLLLLTQRFYPKLAKCLERSAVFSS